MARRLTVFATVAILTMALMPGVAAAAGPRFTPGSPGLGDPYYPLDGNGGYDVDHYDLDVAYAPDRDRLDGVATIKAKATQDLSAFNLDFVGLHVRSIKVDDRSARWSRRDAELTVTPKDGIRKGSRFTVVVTYDGSPDPIEDIFGLSGFVHTQDGALVVGQPHVAATWFPANDHPRDKASFTFHITVPAGVEAVANGILKGQDTHRGKTTWTWDAEAPMATYLAGMGIGQFSVRAFKKDGIKFWDAIDSTLLEDALPPGLPQDGQRLLYSQIAETDVTYKRLTRVIDVPVTGATLTFKTSYDIEAGWDNLFVEARTVGRDDWTTLPAASGKTSSDADACPDTLFANPFLGHYLTDVPPDLHDPDIDDDDEYFPCAATGSIGSPPGQWNAATGTSDGWVPWVVALPNGTGQVRHLEVSITYASDGSIQGRGVMIDKVVVSNGQGTTSFEADGNPLDGWVPSTERPDGGANENTWTIVTNVPAVPGIGIHALKSFDKLPEILRWESGIFGKYPFNAGGGIVDDIDLGFALENQTRSIYAPGFFYDPAGDDFVVVHENAHQWFGDHLGLDAWQHIWLNEGFATYAEWLWSEHEGFNTVQEIYDFFVSFPSDDPFWELPIGDPTPDHLFDGEVYYRGAATLHALRLKVGDRDFFTILREWVKTQGGGTVTTDEFIRLAERISHKNLGRFFREWLSSGRPASLPEPPPPDPGIARRAGPTVAVPAQVRSLDKRLARDPRSP